MSFNRYIAVAAVLTVLGASEAAHAQQDLKPLQADVDSIKQQVSKLQADPGAKPARPTPPPAKAPASKDVKKASPSEASTPNRH